MILDETGPFMGSMVQETVKNPFGMLACVVGHRIYRVSNVAHFHHVCCAAPRSKMKNLKFRVRGSEPITMCHKQSSECPCNFLEL